MQKNKTQYGLLTAGISTLTRDTTRTLGDTLDHAPAEPPEPAELDLRLYGVIDGTLVPCYLWANKPETLQRQT